jgi:hypothetical protein
MQILDSMQYLSAVAAEALRVWPTVVWMSQKNETLKTMRYANSSLQPVTARVAVVSSGLIQDISLTCLELMTIPETNDDCRSRYSSGYSCLNCAHRGPSPRYSLG